MKKRLAASMLAVVMAVFLLPGAGALATSMNTNEPETLREPVAFSNLTANGSNTAATTELTLTFDKDVAGLTVNDITVTGAFKETLIKQSGTGIYKLSISGITVADNGTVNIAIAKNGFTFTPANENVAVRAHTSTVLAVPTITTQPTDQSVTEGQTATFSVAATGNPAPSYQWWENTGAGWARISDATSASYTTSETTLSNNGDKYHCYITNSQGHAISNEVTLSVTRALVDPSASDNSISGITPAQTYAKGDLVTFTVWGGDVNNTSPQNGDKWWLATHWETNPSGNFDTGFTQSFSTSGMTTGTHTLTVTFTQQQYNGTTWVNTGLTDTKSVTFTVEDAPLRPATPVRPAAPIITYPAAARTITQSAGAKASFFVTATGAAPLSFQWQINKGSGWENIFGATSARYTTGAVKKSNNGWKYRCTVTNGTGSATSPVFTLEVISLNIPDTGESAYPWLGIGRMALALAGIAFTAVVLLNKRTLGK